MPHSCTCDITHSHIHSIYICDTPTRATPTPAPNALHVTRLFQICDMPHSYTCNITHSHILSICIRQERQRQSPETLDVSHNAFIYILHVCIDISSVWHTDKSDNDNRPKHFRRHGPHKCTPPPHCRDIDFQGFLRICIFRCVWQCVAV